MPDLERAVRPAAQVATPGTPGPTGLLSLATGVVAVAALSVAREVLIPTTLAVLLSFVLAPSWNCCGGSRCRTSCPCRLPSCCR